MAKHKTWLIEVKAEITNSVEDNEDYLEDKEDIISTVKEGLEFENFGGLLGSFETEIIKLKVRKKLERRKLTKRFIRVNKRTHPYNKCLWYYRGKRITLKQLKKKIDNKEIKPTKGQRQLISIQLNN